MNKITPELVTLLHRYMTERMPACSEYTSDEEVIASYILSTFMPMLRRKLGKAGWVMFDEEVIALFYQQKSKLRLDQ